MNQREITKAAGWSSPAARSKRLREINFAQYCPTPVKAWTNGGAAEWTRYIIAHEAEKAARKEESK